MQIPSTKEDFLNLMEKETSATITKYALVPSHIENFVKEFFLSKFNFINPCLPSIYGYKGNFQKYFEAIWDRNKAFFDMPVGNSPEDRKRIMGRKITDRKHTVDWLYEVESSKDWNNGWFTKLPYQERKYLMPVRDFKDYEKSAPDIQLFRISHIPSDVKFEDCFPTIGELYIAHPYRAGIYLPVSKYEHLIFRERIHELSKVMMALGATEIRTLQSSDKKFHSSDEGSTNTSASAGVDGRGSVKGSYSRQSKNMYESEKSNSIVINFKNDPLDLPKVPEGLIWFPHDKEWQHIADSRLFGNILEYEISLSSKDLNLVSDMEKRNIEAQARLFFVSGNFSNETFSTSFFKEEVVKTTTILMKFKSRKDY